MLATHLERAIESAMAKHMVFCKPEPRPMKFPGCVTVVHDTEELNPAPRKSHSLPVGPCFEERPGVNVSDNVRGRRSSATVDILAVEDVIRCASVLDSEVSSIHTAWSGESSNDIIASFYGRCYSESSAPSCVNGPEYDSVVSGCHAQNVQQAPGEHNPQHKSSFTSASGALKVYPQESVPPSDQSERNFESMPQPGLIVPNARSTLDSKYTRHLKVLYACYGIIPWSSSRCSRCYRTFIRFASACAAAFCIVDLMLHQSRLYELFSEAALSIGSFVSLILLGKLECLVGGSTDFLGQHAKRHKFLTKWGKSGTNKLFMVIVVWICKTGTSIVRLSVLQDTVSFIGICRCFVAIFEAGLHLAIVHGLCHALTFLEFMLDAYSDEFYSTNAWAQGVCSWNVVQAMLHDLARRVDSTFLAMQTSSVIVFLSFAAGILNCIKMRSGATLLDRSVWAAFQLPTLMMALAAFVPFVKAACVTEACIRIPPVMNSFGVTHDNAINRDRQYLVSYILHSQAGFRVKGNLISSTLLLNYCYLCGAVACGLFTTGLSVSQQQ